MKLYFVTCNQVVTTFMAFEIINLLTYVLTNISLYLRNGARQGHSY